MSSWHYIAIGLLASVCVHRDRVSAFSHVKLAGRHSALASAASYLGQSHYSVFEQRPPSSISRPIIISPICSSASSDDGQQSPRSKLRQLTGFSLTALRTTLRAATGFSLSQTISGSLRRILGFFHPGLRYFLQPLLIMYYAPMLLIRYWLVGPSQQYVEESRKGHEKVVDGWRKAVEAAEKANAGGYWPVHLNDDGTITTSLPPDPNVVLDLTDGIEKSVAAATTASEAHVV